MQDDRPATDARGLELLVGRGVPVELRRLLRATEHFAILINAVSAAYTGESGGVRWIVEVRPGSVRLPVVPEPARDVVQPSAVAELPELIGAGIAQVAREAVRPDYFTDRALEELRELAKVAEVDFPMTVDDTKLSTQVIVNVDKILGAPRYSIGTVEGRLEAISLHDGSQFSVWPGGRGKHVKCLFGQHVQLDEVLAAVGRRVAARGRIKTRPDGRRESVEVHSLRVLNEQPVDADDVRGLFHGREAAGW